MDDLISRQAAIDFKVSRGLNEDGILYVPYADVKKHLEQLPTAELPDTNVGDIISRQAAIDEFYMATCDVDKVEWAEIVLKRVPSAERKGHWQITDAYPHNVYCSECHKRFAQTHWAVWEDGSLPRTYCPNCGARMDGEQ